VRWCLGIRPAASAILIDRHASGVLQSMNRALNGPHAEARSVEASELAPLTDP